MVWLYASIHLPDKKFNSFFSLPWTPYIGVISKVPIPALEYCSMFHFRPSLVTAEPIHHHLVPGFVSLVATGHDGLILLVCAFVAQHAKGRTIPNNNCLIMCVVLTLN